MRDHRPNFHVCPPAGWLNDPNGPTQRDGRYHVFFQRNPAAPVWAPETSWGHAVSTDLARWTHLPDALVPTPGSADAGGCWSGCVVDDHGVPTAVYSGLRRMSAFGAETVCLARGDDDLVHWRKDERNPVLPGPPAGLDLVACRDPFVWREAGGWSMVIGAGLEGVGGAVLRFRSPDLVDWEYTGVVLSREAEPDSTVSAGRAWECPQLFPLGDRHVLIVSVQGDDPQQTVHAVAFVGDYRDGRFEPEHVERFDHGADLYAPATMLDERGRRLAWGWSWEARDEAAAHEQGWAGVLTAPRVLTLAEDGRLGLAPAPELEALRGGHETLQNVPIGEVTARTRGDRLDLAAAVMPRDAASIRLDVCTSPLGEERTTIAWDRTPGRLTVDRSRSSLDPRAHGGRHGGPLDLAGGDLELRVLVDRSIVEVFANGRLALTERIYPTREDSTGVAVSATGGEALLRRLDVWQLEP